ncbi:hypothetical protein G7054_g7474 [Neopestalotiopsis clavispora]|nr:hypothetical protein G7054_g7474 [Neopestalotiopsis clavispora]
MQKYNYEPLPPAHIRIATLLPARYADDTTIQLSLREAMFDVYHDDELDDSRKPIKNSNAGSKDNKKSFLYRMKQIVTKPDHGTVQGYPLRPGCKKPRYEALSYAWGPGTGTTPAIMLSDGRRQDAHPFHIGDNLFAALKQLRRGKPRDLWIDQICINQEDELEKGAQVAMMGAIYANAHAVVAWIGEANDQNQLEDEDRDPTKGQAQLTEENRLAFTALTNLGQHLIYTASDPPNMRDIAYMEEGQDRWLPQDLSPDGFEAAEKMLRRRWCKRLWIRQEVGLANQESSVMVCGSLTMPWKFFRAGGIYISVVRNKADPLPFPILAYGTIAFESLLNQIAPGQIMSGEASLSVLREMSWSTGCTDHRDRIYANRALLRADESKRIRPDYLKPVHEVYRDTVVYYLRACKDLTILNQCRWSTLSGESSKAPTWVPDWSDIEVPMMSKYFLTDGCLKATGRLTTSFGIEGNILQVAAVYFDTISTRISLSIPSDTESHDRTLDAFREFLISDSRSLSSHYRANLAGVFTLGDAYMLSLFACELDWASPAPTRPHELSDDLSQRLQDTRLWISTLEQASGGPAREIPECVVTCIANAQRRKIQLFRSDRGRVGISWAPAMQPGDSIWMLFGCDVPMILRPMSSIDRGSNTADGAPLRYQVLGPAFVPWFSYGEPILGELPAVWKRFYNSDYGEEFVNEDTGKMVQIDPRLRELPFALNVSTELWPKEEQLRDRFVDVPFDQLQSALSERGVKVEQLDLI